MTELLEILKRKALEDIAWRRGWHGDEETFRNFVGKEDEDIIAVSYTHLTLPTN